MVLFIPFFLYYFGYNYYLIVTEKFWSSVDGGGIYLAIKYKKHLPELTQIWDTYKNYEKEIINLPNKTI